MTTDVKTPREFGRDELSTIEMLIRRGGEVNVASLARNLPHAQVIAVAKEGEQIVSVCVLKRVNPRHNKTVSMESGALIPENASEFGYVFTDEVYRGRGYGSAACAALLQGLGFVYATARTTNNMMRSILMKHNFDEVAQAWPSIEHTGESITLWIHK